MANFIKTFLRSPRKALLSIEGPTHCDYAANIAKAFGGKQILIREGGSINFGIPQTDHSALREFFAQHASHTIPAITVTSIPGGRVYAGGVVMSPDGSTVARDLSMDFGAPFGNHFLCGKRIQRPQLLKGNTLCVASVGTKSYYHWLLDELPRYLVSDLDTPDQIICSRDTDANRLALRLMGLEKIPIFYFDGPNRRLGKHYMSDDLTVPSYVAPSGEPTPFLVELLASFVEPLISKSPAYPEKIFVSRGKANGRRLLNEDRIYASFEAKGYVRVWLEDLRWQEQVNLFYHAREIVAPHGAGLANLVFCSKKPLVVELFNARYTHWCFWKLAELVGASYIPIALPIGGAVEHNIKHILADIELTDSDSSVVLQFANV